LQGVVKSVSVYNLNRQNIKQFFFISFDRNISFSPSDSFIQFDKRIRKQFETFPSLTDKRTISQEQKIQEMFYISNEFENVHLVKQIEEIIHPFRIAKHQNINRETLT
jgi:hypothetical protein